MLYIYTVVLEYGRTLNGFVGEVVYRGASIDFRCTHTASTEDQTWKTVSTPSLVDLMYIHLDVG